MGTFQVIRNSRLPPLMKSAATAGITRGLNIFYWWRDLTLFTAFGSIPEQSSDLKASASAESAERQSIAAKAFQSFRLLPPPKSSMPEALKPLLSLA